MIQTPHGLLAARSRGDERGEDESRDEITSVAGMNQICLRTGYTFRRRGLRGPRTEKLSRGRTWMREATLEGRSCSFSFFLPGTHLSQPFGIVESPTVTRRPERGRGVHPVHQDGFELADLSVRRIANPHLRKRVSQRGCGGEGGRGTSEGAGGGGTHTREGEA